MSYLIAAPGIRFTVAAIIYIGTVSIWVSNTRGWEAIGLFGISVIFGFFAAAAILAAAIIGRWIPNRWVRLVAHPPIVVVLFIAMGPIVGGVLMSLHNDIGKDIRPFTALVAILATIDALAGHGLDGWVVGKQNSG